MIWIKRIFMLIDLKLSLWQVNAYFTDQNIMQREDAIEFKGKRSCYHVYFQVYGHLNVKNGSFFAFIADDS